MMTCVVFEDGDVEDLKAVWSACNEAWCISGPRVGVFAIVMANAIEKRRMDVRSLMAGEDIMRRVKVKVRGIPTSGGFTRARKRVLVHDMARACSILGGWSRKAETAGRRKKR